MTEARREEIITQIKEVTERIEAKLSDYRTKYYQEMPLPARITIYDSVEIAICETRKVSFANEMKNNVYFSGIVDLASISTDSICTSLEKVVNETLKFYNSEFANNLVSVISELKKSLEKYHYDVRRIKDFIVNLSVTLNFNELADKYPDLDELNEYILIIMDIEFVNSRIIKPEIYELYGLKALLEVIEGKISSIGAIEDKSCFNVILEYIDSKIDFDLISEIV